MSNQDYNIILPVCAPAFLVKERIKELKPVINQVILINNWDDPETYKYCLEAADMGAEVWHCPWNLGLAASWNFGIKRMQQDKHDFVIIMAASTVLDQDIRLFVDLIDQQEAETPNFYARYIYHPTNLHLFAHTKLSPEYGGLYDENCWPIYTEDVDYCCRSKLNNMLVEKDITRCTHLHSKNHPTNKKQIAHSYKISISCNEVRSLADLLSRNHGRCTDYYHAKWGGCHNSEKFTHPFDDPTKDVDEWSIEVPFAHNNLYTPFDPNAHICPADQLFWWETYKNDKMVKIS